MSIKSKLDYRSVELIRKMVSSDMKMVDIAEFMGVAPSTITAIKNAGFDLDVYHQNTRDRIAKSAAKKKASKVEEPKEEVIVNRVVETATGNNLEEKNIYTLVSEMYKIVAELLLVQKGMLEIEQTKQARYQAKQNAVYGGRI